MAIVVIQSTSGTGVAGAATPSNWSGATTAGNLLVATVLAARSALAGVPTITPPAGWTAVNDDGTEGTAAGSAMRGAVYYYANAPSESSPAAWASSTFMGTGPLHVVLYEVSGCLTASPLDVSSHTNGDGSLVSSKSTGTTGTTAQATEIAIGLAGINTATTSPSATNSFTVGSSATNQNISIYKILSATGTVESTVSWTTVGRAVGAIATFKGAAAASDTGVQRRMFLAQY